MRAEKIERPFVIPVRELPTHREFSLSAGFVQETMRGLPMREAMSAEDAAANIGEGHATFDLYIEGTHVFISGPFKGHVYVACSRCVGPAKLEIDEQLRVTFMPHHELPSDDALDVVDSDLAKKGKGGDRGKGKGKETDKDVEMPATTEIDGDPLADGDLDLFGYDGENLDLELLLREQFVLAVPYAPLCTEDCLGLCGQCGIDRNHGTCQCEKPIDPRLSGLKSLKLPS
jgi:uncharacterized protein